MRWNCTVSHESANEQPCDFVTPVSPADPRRLFARGLVVLEHALVDDAATMSAATPSSSQATAGERTFLRAIALDVHQLGRPYLSFPICFSGGAMNDGAGVVGLVADAPDRVPWDVRWIRGS